jgi:hypothetical protein
MEGLKPILWHEHAQHPPELHLTSDRDQFLLEGPVRVDFHLRFCEQIGDVVRHSPEHFPVEIFLVVRVPALAETLIKSRCYDPERLRDGELAWEDSGEVGVCVELELTAERSCSEFWMDIIYHIRCSQLNSG